MTVVATARWAQTGRIFSRSALTLAIFAAHHAYGAWRYSTHWRLHGAAFALFIAGVFAVLHAAARAGAGTRPGRLAAWTLVALSVAVVVVAVGAFEGAYNHVLKDLLYLAGTHRDLLLRLFPPPAYELPNDAFFEISGVLQVAPAVSTALACLRFVRDDRP